MNQVLLQIYKLSPIQKPVKSVPPAINILNPGTSPFNTFEPLQEFKATITGVSGKENISLSFNGIKEFPALRTMTTHLS